jgi:hypothetical protein
MNDGLEAFAYPLMRIYKKFLIGSKVCEKVLVTSYGELLLLVHVALTHPESLQQLRQVHNLKSSFYSYDQAEFEQNLDRHCEVNLMRKDHSEILN